MRKIYKFLVLVVLATVLSLVLAACGENTPTAVPPTTAIANTTTQNAATSITATQATTTAITQASTTSSTTIIQNPTTLQATTTANPTTTAASQSQNTKNFDHVLIIVLENTDFSTAMANPYLSQLTIRGTLLSNYFAITHPSYPNYLAMVGGSTFGQTDDGQEDLDKTNLVDLMEAAGITWKAYAEALPAKSCYTGVQTGTYVRKHEPFASFVDVQTNPQRCAKIVNSDQLQKDAASGNLPQYMFFAPDLNDDGHDTGVKYSANWLKNFLPTLEQNSAISKDTLIIITFDEGTNGSSNQIYTLLLGPMVKAGNSTSIRYDHYSLLRTIEDNFGLPTLGREDSKAKAFSDIWVK
jgi:phospholipase C